MPWAEPWLDLFSLGHKISKSSYQKSQPEKKGKKGVKIWVQSMDPKFLSFHIASPSPFFPVLQLSYSFWEKVAVGKQREKTTNTAVELFNEPE